MRRRLGARDVRQEPKSEAEQGTIQGVGPVMHDGKCRHPEKRPMGDGVPYRRSICFVGSSAAPGKGVEQGRTVPVVFPKGRAELCGL